MCFVCTSKSPFPAERFHSRPTKISSGPCFKIREVAGEGAGKSAAKIRGAGGSAGEGAARGTFLGKE